MKFLILDFDGVLCDQREFDYFSFAGVCSELNLPRISFSYFVQLRKNELRSEELFLNAFKCSHDKLQKALLLRKKWFKKNINTFIPQLIKGIDKKIKRYEGRLQLAIATMRLQPDIPLKLIERYQLPIPKENIYCVKRLNRLTKKDFKDSNVFDVKAAMLNYIKNRYSLKNNSCFYIGDTLDDCKAALKVGICFGGVLTGYVKREKFLNEKVIVGNNVGTLLPRLLKS